MKAEKNDQLQTLRHSAAHLLAHAVLTLHPDTQLTIGPATADGFFYDFLPTKNFKEEDLPKIEALMHEIAKQNLAIEHREIPKAEAREIYKNNPFKLELIELIPGDTVGLATQGDFTDLCKGGHVASTQDIKHFKLLGISGSYWRADRNNQNLQRISGTAFFTQQELDEHLQRREDALNFDHRKVGKQLDLFSFHDEGAGFPFFHAKGTTVLNIMKKYVRELLDKAGYQEIMTPTMLNESLWKQSGHYAHYKKNMYFCTIDESTYAIKPMNCPGSILLYKERPHSYRELPIRLAEFGHVHRFELSGVLHGLFRARAFTIDDGHIYCRVDQIEQEVLTTILMVNQGLRRFGFDTINIKLSTRPDNAMGSDEWWEIATNALKTALEKAGLAYEISEGDGAFYGPKIEFHIEDSLKRSWQCGTVQLDPFLPENFDLTYVTSEGTKERPVMIHRAIYGSFERFLGVILEHYKGTLPFWLAPVQVRVLTITDAQKEYARGIAQTLKDAGIRVEVDASSDPISGQIKDAQLQKIPWMLVIGKKETEKGVVTLRTLDGKQQFDLSIEELLKKAGELNSSSV